MTSEYRKPRAREKKPGPLTNLTPEERLDRYAVLMRFTTEDDIDINKLVDQWNCSDLGVRGMLNQARNNRNLYRDLREQGFADDEFPEWWYSPARNAAEQPGTASKSPVQTELKGNGSVPLTPATPKIPAPREAGPGRPPLPVQLRSDPLTTDEDEEVPASTEGFTKNEIDLLGSRGIVRGEDGIWKHIETEPSGRTIITPVNPIAELQRISSQAQGDAILQNVNKHMIEQLELSTQSIIKKVALNPTVFWLFQYVTSIRDKSTGLPLFVGDIGDFLSFCVRFTGEAFYGVVPTYVTNRPSFLTALRQHQRAPGRC